VESDGPVIKVDAAVLTALIAEFPTDVAALKIATNAYPDDVKEVKVPSLILY
jgi:hypothetical protein